MRLYIVRHGHAEVHGGAKPDRERRLTAEGTARLKQQARVLGHGTFPVERVLTSPYVRARQTAEIFAEALGAPVQEDTLLASGATMGDVAALLRKYDLEHIMLVGHQPDLGHLIADLTGCQLRVSPGTLAIVETSAMLPGRGQLRAFFDPDLMIRFAEAL